LSFAANANLLLGQTFSGDALTVLGGPFSGPPVFGGSSSFNFATPTSGVQGQWVVSQVTMQVVPEASTGLLLAGATLAFALARRPKRV
jgi:hypothetical protein